MLKPGYVKELRFHLATKTAPAVSGNLATSIVGSSALHVRVLAPKGAAITAAWNTVGDDKVNARLAITSAGPGKDLDALDVITADDKGAAPPEAALVAVEHELMTGAVIRARGSAPADRDQVVLFATSPTASLPSAAVVSYRADAARPSRHHLFDLEAQHQFYVRVDRATGAARLTVGQQGPAGVAVTSNDAGVLQFELAGGEIHPLQ
jgi:hypothetical protein